MYKHIQERAESRFWQRVRRSHDDQCWEYAGHRHRQGYGYRRWRGKRTLAHRLAWQLTHGAIPEGLDVLHRCDNPPCCNPKHLFLGTQLDNIKDMTTKNRQRAPRGAKAHFAKLTAAKVLKLRRMYDDGTNQVLLAKKFGVSQSSISAAILRKTWKHVK